MIPPIPEVTKVFFHFALSSAHIPAYYALPFSALTVRAFALEYHPCDFSIVPQTKTVEESD